MVAESSGGRERYRERVRWKRRVRVWDMCREK